MKSNTKVSLIEVEASLEPETRIWSKTKQDWLSKVENQSAELEAKIDKLLSRNQVQCDGHETTITPRQQRQNRAMSRSFKDDTRLDEINTHIDDCASALSRKLHFPRKQLARILCYWAKRVPIDEREDLIQELTLKVLAEAPESLKLAFVIMKRDTIDYMRKFYTFEKSRLSLDTPTSEDSTLGDIIPDTFEFTEVVNLKADTARLLAEMGATIRGIVGRKLAGVRLTNEEKRQLEDFGRKHLDFVYA